MTDEFDTVEGTDLEGTETPESTPEEIESGEVSFTPEGEEEVGTPPEGTGEAPAIEES